MAHDMTPEQQDEAVHTVIVAVASVCDGAQSKDFQGFNGVDTHYGRRIAARPYSEWTPEIKAECAHIVLKYREQGIKLTGIDVGTLPVVRDAQDNGTNYTARNQARRFEQQSKLLADRKVDVVTHPKTRKPCIGIFFNGKEKDLFVPIMRKLPGREFDWDRKCNAVFVSDEAHAFIQENDFAVSDAARALLEAPRQAPQAPARPAEIIVDTTQAGKVFIKTNKTAPGTAANDAVKALPGRWFDRGRYGNQVDARPAVVAFARTYDIVISPEAQALCEAGAQPAQEAPGGLLISQEDLNVVMAEASRSGAPDELPEVFVTLFHKLMEGE
jgi:hypothetical protein